MSPLLDTLDNVVKRKIIPGWSIWKKVITVFVVFVVCTIVIGIVLVAIRWKVIQRFPGLLSVFCTKRNKKTVEGVTCPQASAIVVEGASSSTPVIEDRKQSDTAFKVYPPN